MHWFVKNTDVLDEQGNATTKQKERIIYNASSTDWNACTAAAPVNYDDAHTAIANLSPNALQATFDESDAFLMKPVNWRYRLGVTVAAPDNESEIYCAAYVTFGVSWGPRTQMRYSRTVCNLIHRGALAQILTESEQLRSQWEAVTAGTVQPPPRVAILMDDYHMTVHRTTIGEVDITESLAALYTRAFLLLTARLGLVCKPEKLRWPATEQPFAGITNSTPDPMAGHIGASGFSQTKAQRIVARAAAILRDHPVGSTISIKR
jgi:hypothetical protein